VAGERAWRHRAEVAHVESPGRVALLDLDHLDRPPVILEGSAAVIWELLDGTRDDGAVTSAVADHFGVPEAEVAQPVADFLAQVRELGLIEPA
jgi:pyrroloquinoline quinone biosynthesis protein D